MSKVLGIAQLLELASKMKKESEQVAFLQENFSGTLADILIYAYHPQVKFLLPEGAPPYSPVDIEHQEHVLFREVRKIPNLIEGQGERLTQGQREKIFIDILQNVAPRDAEMLIGIKDRVAPYGIPASTIRKAFPDLLPKEL